MSERVPEARFLSVACFEKKITRTQAWQIAQQGQKYLLLSIDPPRCGQIAIDLGILTHDMVEWLLQRLDCYRNDNKVLDDPLARRPPSRIFTPAGSLRSVIICSVTLLLLVATWFFSHKNWGAVGLAAGLTLTIWLILSNIGPDIFRGNLAAHRLAPWLSMLIGPLAWGYGMFLIYTAFHSSSGMPRDLESLWLQFSYSMLALAGSFGVFMALAQWRHREIWYLEARAELMRGLVVRAYAAISRVHREAVQPDRQHVLSEARELILATARILTLNPWAKFLDRIVFGFGPLGTLSVWYLEPDSDDPQTFERFNIVSVAAPGASLEVLTAFDRIQRTHHPVKLNEDQFQRAITGATRNGELDHEIFRRVPDRNDFVSAVGYVFHYGRGIDSGNAREDMFFDHSYARSIAKGQMTYTVRRWLDFNSFAAYPVIAANSEGVPCGVLIAFNNIRNGITPEDKHVLVTASRLLGLLMSETNPGSEQKDSYDKH